VGVIRARGKNGGWQSGTIYLRLEENVQKEGKCDHEFI
jgi:hypothetical protein